MIDDTTDNLTAPSVTDASAADASAADAFTLRLPNYEGPMDALLRLVEERELEITAVSLAIVADQFIAHMMALPSRDPKEIAGFVSIAARLILLKSRALLPSIEPVRDEDEGDTDDLVAQLRAYQLYKRAAQVLRQRESANIRSYLVEPPPVARPVSRQLPLDNVTLDQLAKAMQRVVDRWLPPAPVESVMSRLPFTVNDCIDRIRSRVTAGDRVSFTDVLEGIDIRGEVVITLLALLELLKRYEVRAWQGTLFGEILIERLPADERPTE